jgi:uncharacterized membrane protein YeaQ/YmgE (transglycosylase-associated protein family)
MFLLIWALIIGLIVSAIEKLITPRKDPGGTWTTMTLGVAGSLIATYLARALGLYTTGQSASSLMSISGAVLLLFLYQFIRARTAGA